MQSTETVKQFFNFGINSFIVRPECVEMLPYQGTSWLYHVKEYDDGQYDLNTDKWTIEQFVAFFGWKICKYRASNDRSLTLSFITDKNEHGRLCHEMKDVLSSHGSDKAYKRICVLVSCWQHMMRKYDGGITSYLELGAGVLYDHSIVRMWLVNLHQSSHINY